MEVRDLPKKVILQTIKDKGMCLNAYHNMDGQDVFCKTDNNPIRNNIGFYMYVIKTSSNNGKCFNCPFSKHCPREHIYDTLIQYAQEHYPVDLYKILIEGE